MSNQQSNKQSHSNQSTTSLDSATTLVSSTNTHLRPPPQKDYAAALGALQSRYGTGGRTPSPKMKASDKLPVQSTAGGSSNAVYNSTQGSSSSTDTPSSSISSLNTLGDSGDSQKGKDPKEKKSLFRSLIKGKGKGKEKEKEKERNNNGSSSSQS